MTDPAEAPPPRTDGAAAASAAAALLELYDRALPEVYGYVLRRCGEAALAEDLTAEVFFAAVEAVRHSRANPASLTVGWLITVARNKLVDHWRRLEREQRMLHAIQGGADGADATIDDWDATLTAADALATLAELGPHHRAALTLRYLDGLAVREVAGLLGRSEGATEVLLVRARRAFRAAYEQTHREGPR